jgi:hypothetical protein
MQWIDVREQLPKHGQRCIAWCRHEHGNENEYWMGIVDVNFDVNIGWTRNEYAYLDLFVLFWMDHSVIAPPAVEK